MVPLYQLIQSIRKFAYVGLAGCLWLSSCSNRSSLQLIRSSSELSESATWPRVKSIGKESRRHQVKISDLAGHHQWVSVDSVWGYRTPQHQIFRLYGRNRYELMHRGTMVIYRLIEFSTTSNWEHYYFSLTPDSAIWPLDKQTCLGVFHTNPCLHDLLSRMRPRQLLSVDAHGTWGLVKAYEYCQAYSRLDR